MKYDKIHPCYYAIPMYITNNNMTYDYVAEYMGISLNDFIEKIIGLQDFDNQEAITLSVCLNRTQDEIFLT